MNELGSYNDNVVFFDAPFIELFEWWEEVQYKIHFKTIFQYSKSSVINENIIPILSIDWKLIATCRKNDDKWEIIDSKYSSTDEIVSSIIEYSEDDPAFSPCNLKHLGQEVHNFKLKIPELRLDFKSNN